MRMCDVCVWDAFPSIYLLALFLFPFLYNGRYQHQHQRPIHVLFCFARGDLEEGGKKVQGFLC
jgi:hypothetical protein